MTPKTRVRALADSSSVGLLGRRCAGARCHVGLGMTLPFASANHHRWRLETKAAPSNAKGIRCAGQTELRSGIATERALSVHGAIAASRSLGKLESLWHDTVVLLRDIALGGHVTQK